MDERLSELLASLRERFEPEAAADEEVRDFLASEGYDERRIGEILVLFRGHTARVSPGARSASLAPRREEQPGTIRDAMVFRVLGPHERGRFAPEAWGYLLSLSGSGVLSAAELEHVIDRALSHVEGRVGLDDLRSLLEAASDEGDGRSPAGKATIH